MTIWVPDLSGSTQPTYIAIVEAIGDAIRVGQLRPGDPLPTHRLLADLLGVNVSTVTRAYQEAARRRLVDGEVGRGTYVLGVASEAALFALQHRPEGGVIDLSLNMPPVATRDSDLAAFTDQLGPVEAARLLHYPTPGETLVHRQAAAGWLKRRGLEADPDGLVVCAGAQHAMDTAISLFPEWDEVACEALVYPGLKAAARHWQRRLHAMAMDREGLRTDAFEAACRGGLKLAVVSPTLHNPTTATMGLERRRRIVEIARKHDVLLVEEDVYGLLREDAPPPLATLAPERVVYLTGLSKTVAPGLRIGYLLFPPGLRARVRDAEHHTTWYVSALTMALATRWLTDGTAWRRLQRQRRELEVRHRLCGKHLEGLAWRGEPHCPHVWLPAPPGGSQDFVRRAQAAGVVVVPSSVLAAGRTPSEDGVRISIGAPPNRNTLSEGLARLAALRT
ncbi:MAG TPA: PLP-dependent aminotransferase family protein [Holophaga sp.]|nr:PLP-dependent aminotransferase family protein [Holophaga sp.]HPS68163.1 PLP-dependent aminotransferase family protein [Holophaga sp.]